MYVCTYGVQSMYSRSSMSSTSMIDLGLIILVFA